MDSYPHYSEFKFHQPVQDIFLMKTVICLSLKYSSLNVVLTFHLAPSVLKKCSENDTGALLWFGPVAMQMESMLECRRKI